VDRPMPTVTRKVPMSSLGAIRRRLVGASDRESKWLSQ
jgi:hypothetical protein